MGTVLGYVVGGLLGALVGAFAGRLFDSGLKTSLLFGSPEKKQHIELVFFKTVFTIIGYIAKADGRVSEEEIGQTEALMAQLGLSADHRREAIELFKQGTQPDFQLDNVLNEFKDSCHQFPNLTQMLLVYLVGVALADGVLHPAEEQSLRAVAQGLGYSATAFEQLMAMIKAQSNFHHGHHTGGSPEDLALAYQALGVTQESTDAEIKRAYRRLMSEYHPDKLIGDGVPEDMVRVATEKSQEVQTAYDLIKKDRKNNADRS